MKILACICTATGAAVSDADAFERRGRAGRSVLSPYDARAVEQALRLAEAGDGEVVVAAVATATELGQLREALAFGASRAVLVDDAALDGSDLIAISRVLAALIRTERPDIAIACFWSGDIDGSLLWAATAERLGWPVVTQVSALEVRKEDVIARRQVEVGDIAVVAPLPCLIEVAESINRPRYPTIKAKVAAKTKPVHLCTLSDLGIAPELVGSRGAGTVRTALTAAPSGREPRLLAGSAATAEAVVAFLREREFVR